MPTDAQRRNLASAHRAEVQALNERIAQLQSTLAASCDDEREQLWEATPGGGCSRALDAERKIALLEQQLAEAKRDAKLYAGMLVYGQEVVFQRGAETTIEEAMAAIDAKSSELNSDDLDAWDCPTCCGTGKVTEMHAVTHQLGTDMLPFGADCPACDGIGHCGPDAEKRAAITSAQEQT